MEVHQIYNDAINDNEDDTLISYCDEAKKKHNL